jgi:hypothetical protein
MTSERKGAPTLRPTGRSQIFRGYFSSRAGSNVNVALGILFGVAVVSGVFVKVLAPPKEVALVVAGAIVLSAIFSSAAVYLYTDFWPVRKKIVLAGQTVFFVAKFPAKIHSVEVVSFGEGRGCRVEFFMTLWQWGESLRPRKIDLIPYFEIDGRGRVTGTRQLVTSRSAFIGSWRYRLVFDKIDKQFQVFAI